MPDNQIMSGVYYVDCEVKEETQSTKNMNDEKNYRSA
jgi:hypothetical protein